MLFSYNAQSKTGEISQGILESGDRFAVARELRSRGFTPLSIAEKKESAWKQFGNFGHIFSRVSMSEQILLTKNLSGMLRAGLSLSRAISVLKKQTKNPKLGNILTSLADEINSGGSLSGALAKFSAVFSPLFVSMVRAGEESGNLSGALSEIGMNLEKSHALTKKIHGALVYPGVILSAMVVIGVLMFAFVVPTLAGTFKELGVTLPASTRFIIALGSFFSDHLIVSFVIIIGAAFGIFSLFRAKFMATPVDLATLKIPMISTMTKELNAARTARSISSLLSSGVSVTRALEITEDVVQNTYYKKALRKTRESVEKGAPFSEVFAKSTDIYPIMMTEMIEVGEETGKLADMLREVALFYEEEIENKTKNLSTIIEPFLMIIIGAGVGFFAISMISPLYSILGEIG